MVVLENDKLYSILINIHYLNNGVVNGISPMKSMVITGSSSVKLISFNILNALNKVYNEYNIDNANYGCVVKVHWREWIADSEYDKLIEPIKRNEIINQVLQEQANLKLDQKSKIDKIMKFMSINNMQNYINEFPSSITQLDVYNNSDNDMFDSIQKLKKDCSNITVYKPKTTNSIQDNMITVSEAGAEMFKDDNTLYFVFELVPGKKRIVCVADTETWNISLKYWNSSKYPYPKWTDEFISENSFIRTIGEYKYHITNGTVAYWERLYNFPDMMMPNRDKKKHDTKIGTLDLETFSLGCGTDLLGGGLGELSVYSGGCALNTGYKALYYIDSATGLNTGDDIIQKLFGDLFDHIAENVKGRNNYTLYAHNLGRFDSVFILKSLAKAGYEFNAKWQENDILSVKIYDKERNLTIKLMDSIKLIPNSLEKILISYGCTINKGLFPHKFINKDNLNYIGPKPDIKYFLEDHKMNELKLMVYNDLPEIFNIKEQCLEYLEKDILGLLDVMNQVSFNYFNEYKLNVTKYATLPSISLAIYGYWFKDNKHSIKMIKGPLEN